LREPTKPAARATRRPGRLARCHRSCRASRPSTNLLPTIAPVVRRR
jgi:hypothetical protein